MQPAYSLLGIKVQARAKNIEIYRSLTGNHSLPENKQYWTLANLQDPNNEGTEIVQLKRMGFLIADSQFYGVDNNEDIIIQDKIWNPDANFIWGDWEDAIREVDNFNPSLVYLDMTSFVETKNILYAINSTMMRCKKGTVILVNTMLNDPRSSKRFDGSYIVSELPLIVPSLELSKWKQEVSSFTYNATGHTEMKTFIFIKERE